MGKKVALQDMINKIQPYFVSFEMKESLYIVRIALPEKWSAYNRDDELIKVAKSDTEWFYYASVNDVDLNEIFELIEETIATNESVNKKIELMRVRMEELKDLFQNESLERLEGLKFVFEAPKRQKRTYTKRKKAEASTTISEETVNDNISSREEPPVVYNNNEVDNIDL